ncbi:MAG: hypothetical protein AAGJ18_02935 [Bacteroidota bacterium]
MQKIIISIILCLSLATTHTFAQGGKKQLRERIAARKVSFITNRLELTPEEAQQFWPVYNEYETKKESIKVAYDHRGSFNLLTDEEVENYLGQQLEKEEKMLSLKKEYVYKLKEVLPIRKVAMLPRMENRFKEWMLTQIRERRGKN